MGSHKTQRLTCLGKKIINFATELLTSLPSISAIREYQMSLLVREAGNIKQWPRFSFHVTVGELHSMGKIQSVETEPQLLDAFFELN